MSIASAFQFFHRLAEQERARAGSAHELLASIFALVSPNVKRENTENRGEQALRIQPQIPAINLKIGKLTPEEVEFVL